MKHSLLSIACLAISLLSPLCSISFAEVTGTEDYKEIIGIVREWSPNGKAIQVGDHTISDFKTTWSDNGSGKITQVGSQNIKTGGAVKAYLIKEDENGFWTADRIVILSGSAVSPTVTNQPSDKKVEITNPPSSSEKKPFLENGVWKN